MTDFFTRYSCLLDVGTPAGRSTNPAPKPATRHAAPTMPIALTFNSPPMFIIRRSAP